MIRPLNDNVVLKKEKLVRETASGIVLSQKEEEPEYATVVAVSEEKRNERERRDNNRSIRILFIRPSYNSCSSVATTAPMAPKEKKDRRNHFRRSFLSKGRSPTNLPFWPFIA